MEYRTYKYRLYPLEEQINKIEHIIECCHFLREQFIEDRVQGTTFSSSYKEILVYYINTYKELQNCDNSALMHEIFNVLDEDKKTVNRIAHSYTTSYLPFYERNFKLQERKVYLPKVGWVKKSKNRPIQEGFRIREFIVFKKEESYFLLIEITLPNKKTQPLNKDNILGLDYSSKHLIIDSNNNHYTIPHFFREEKEKLASFEKELLQYKKGSNRFRATIKKIRKIHQDIHNRRIDYLHKLSTNLSQNYDCIVIETLEMKNITTYRNIALATYDNSYFRFTDMLEYKMREQNKRLIRIDRWFPSTRMCHICGFINPNIDLNTKTWTCPNCHNDLDRDYNAAINIKNEGRRIIQVDG